MPIRPSQRTANVRYAIRDIALVAEEARRAGKKLYPLNIGDPGAFDLATPPHLIEAVERAMRSSRNGYGDSLGLPDAREAIAAEAARRGVRNVRETFLCSGTSEGIEVALAALADRGENVLVPCPGYPLYDAVLHKLEIEPRPYPLVEARGWEPDVDAMASRIDAKTRAIVVINPNNPTGAVVPPATIRRIIDVAAQRGVLLISDEIYDKLVLDGPPCAPLASIADVPVLSFNGLSKAYLAPGWRMGWGILSGPAAEVSAYADAIARLLRSRLCAPHPAMHAVRPALEGDQSHIARTVAVLRRRRDLTAGVLSSIPGVSCVRPAAAFYAFPRLSVTGPDDAFVRALIRETGVMVVHGSGFGAPADDPHVRLVYLPPEETLREALARLSKFVSDSACMKHA